MGDEIQYIGEHLLPGKLGQLAIMLAFCSGILATTAYIFATQRRELAEATSWRKIGRWAFVIHGISVFSIIGVMFYIMVNQYFEYQYVQAHVSEDLPMRYIFSAFWEGQEGSFLLWTFWHVILGFVLIATAKKWEAPVLAVIASVQVILVSMILGVYFGFGDEPFRLGSNPLLLLRDVMDAPIFADPNYASLIEGTGLNPLLQNYWMTIHPPTLFLGFASTVVPFAFAIAGLWTKDHKDWLTPALSWALFSGAILGTGILMGGAWAYEALSFGGYWAWDPVENLSLVPWLIMLAGIHTHLIARSTGQSIRATYIFYALSFILIVYSTFMTRSGVLGETSVHAFTEMGLEWQLTGFIGFYILLSIFFMIKSFSSVPTPEKEEAISSKEFWMFIGSLVLLFSSVLITASTSLPLYNKIQEFFDPSFVGHVITDPEPHFNRYQLWIAVFMALLSGFSQFLRFREINFSANAKSFFIHNIASLAIAALLTYATTFYLELKAWQYSLMLFCGWFTVVANFDHIIFFLKGRLKLAGSALSHIGFGLMLVGIIASGLNKRIISQNPFLMEGLTAEEDARRNTVLLVNNSPQFMGGYEVTLTGDTMSHLTRTFFINYKRYNEDGQVIEEFELDPNVLYDKTFTKIAASNPSTKHYFGRDVFTHVAALPPEEIDFTARQAKEDSLNYKHFVLAPGEALTFQDTMTLKNPDTTAIHDIKVELVEITRTPTSEDYHAQEGDLTLGAIMKVTHPELDTTFTVEPFLVLRDVSLYTFPAQINEINMRLKLSQDMIDQVFVREELLDYQEFTLAEGDQIELNGYNIEFAGFDLTPDNTSYTKQEGDTPVAAILKVSDAEDNRHIAQPVFLIRDGEISNVKDEIPAIGLHARFTLLDHNTGEAQLYLAQKEPAAPSAMFSAATDSFRTDWVALQAIEFPGINLFWLGTCLMMFGLGLSMFHRIQQNRIS